MNKSEEESRFHLPVNSNILLATDSRQNFVSSPFNINPTRHEAQING